MAKRAQVIILLWILVVVIIASVIPPSWYRVLITSLVGFIAGFACRKGGWD